MFAASRVTEELTVVKPSHPVTQIVHILEVEGDLVIITERRGLHS